MKTIVTDVTMAASGIRKGALQRLGVEVKCYLSDERVAAMAAEKGITRTQAGIRLAVEEHPDALFVFGNAPTALMELCDLVRKGKAVPSGIIAAACGLCTRTGIQTHGETVHRNTQTDSGGTKRRK